MITYFDLAFLGIVLKWPRVVRVSRTKFYAKYVGYVFKLKFSSNYRLYTSVGRGPLVPGINIINFKNTFPFETLEGNEK